MTFSELLKDRIVLLDGGTGTALQELGLAPGEAPERWNLTRPEAVRALHRAYFDAGSNVVCTNTFGANPLKFSDAELEETVRAALALVREARAQSAGGQEKFAALDVGPLGRLLKPLGDLDFEDAVRAFARTVELGARYGADLILIETMNDSYETKAALLAAKETCDLPVLVANAYGEDGKLMTGASPAAMVALLEGLGADAVGANCSLGPAQLRGVVRELLETASVPVLLKPNAGLPRVVGGRTVFDVEAGAFSDEVAALVRQGVRLAGGCCGTTPAFIRALRDKLDGAVPVPLSDKGRTVVSSCTHAVVFGGAPVIIGERINPTGKKRLQQALREGDMDYLLAEGVEQQERGAHILDVNVGLPGLDEPALLRRAVCELQAVTDLPLQIDTADPAAMEAALRRFNGKAMVNSVNGKRESMDAVFPLVKKYGGVAVALTLDESGIPGTAEGRFRIAEKILAAAREYGLGPKDLVFDTLAMTVSADVRAAGTTLEALRRIRRELGCHTSLGVSNISFGLPERDAVNSTFFAMALENGLSAAILNPYSAAMRRTWFAYRALKGQDANCSAYIEAARSFAPDPPARPRPEPGPGETPAEVFGSELQRAVVKGFQERAGELARELLKTTPPMTVVNREIIPALNAVGEGFENKTVYLPQLLMSAEAAQRAFAAVKEAFSGGEKPAGRGTFVIATVRGDIHDIGKNIVRLLLENYGFDVVDLGRDVPPETVTDKVVELHAPLAGLSALMTTTVPAMEETIRQLKARAPWCRVVVGGAVLTQEYADRIGADKYARDAMETVRYAESVADGTAGGR